MTADFVHVRLHGHEVLYAGGYPDGLLRRWRDKLRRLASDGKDVYVYFATTRMGGHRTTPSGFANCSMSEGELCYFLNGRQAVQSPRCSNASSGSL